MMKRRGFLSLLGFAPAVPLFAKEIVKAEPVLAPLPPEPMPDIYPMTPINEGVLYGPESEHWGMCTMCVIPNLQERYASVSFTAVTVATSPQDWKGR